MKKHNVKTRLLAGIMTVTTVFSVAGIAAVPASAATVSASVSASIDAESIIKDIAKEGYSKLIGKVTGGNFFTEILGKTSISIFDSLIDGNQQSDTDKILNAVDAVSKKMDAYHDEEMAALEHLSNTVEEMYAEQKTNPFKQDYDSLRKSAANAINDLVWAENKLGENGAAFKGSVEVNGRTVQLIDDNTYSIYEKVLSDSATSISDFRQELNAMYRDIINQSAQLNNKNPYKLLVDANKLICDHQSFSYDMSVLDAPNLNDSRDCIDCMQADVLIHYAAFINLRKMECMVKLHDNPADAENIIDFYNGKDGVISSLVEEMKKIGENYTDANSYFDSQVAAKVTCGEHDWSWSLTKDGDVYYYTSMPKAWAYAVKTANLGVYSQVTVSVFSDWNLDSQTVRGNLPNPCTWRTEIKRDSFGSDCKAYYLNTNEQPAFYAERNSAGNDCLAYFPTNSNSAYLVLDLNGHSLNTRACDMNIGLSNGRCAITTNAYSKVKFQNAGLVNGLEVDTSIWHFGNTYTGIGMYSDINFIP